MNKIEQVKEELISLLSEHQSRCISLGKDLSEENYNDVIQTRLSIIKLINLIKDVE